MFDLREFVMKTLRGMAANEPGYKVNRYALGWFEKDVLTAVDLAEIDLLTTGPEITEETPEGETQTTPDETPEPEGEGQAEAEDTPDSGTEETPEGTE